MSISKLAELRGHVEALMKELQPLAEEPPMASEEEMINALDCALQLNTYLQLAYVKAHRAFHSDPTKS